MPQHDVQITLASLQPQMDLTTLSHEALLQVCLQQQIALQQLHQALHSQQQQGAMNLRCLSLQAAMQCGTDGVRKDADEMVGMAKTFLTFLQGD